MNAQRAQCHYTLANILACKSNTELLSLLNTNPQQHHKNGWGGISQIIELDNQRIFVKKIPITNLEWQENNRFSTQNVFQLPLYYQYGIGSSGFGAWRELAAHRVTTNWVLAGKNPHFPILYGWRIINNQSQSLHQTQEQLEKEVLYWENNAAVKTRLEALNQAEQYLLLFLEYIPYTLHDWLTQQVKKQASALKIQFDSIWSELTDTLKFLHKHHFLHMDAHFKNILTDGTHIYFSDFGLALSNQFHLSSMEQSFIHQHQNYDYCSIVVNLCHSLVTAWTSKEQWDLLVKNKISTESLCATNPYLAPVLKNNYQLIQTMDAFYMDLQHKNKNTPFPEHRTNELIKKFFNVAL